MRRAVRGPAADPGAGSGAPPDPLATRFARHLERTGHIPADRPVLVAISGGIDSVVLLHLLRFHHRDHDLVAAHFDHRMRPDSAADAAWVRGLCLAWRVPLETGVSTGGLRSEAQARAARYAFLSEAADRVAAARILTAHQADDQVETVLFRLLRGGGGLHGIPDRRGRIVRPLLPFRRSEIEAYADRCRIDYREDPSNRRLEYARNRIRHIVLPALERGLPGSANRLLALARDVRDAESAWRQVVDTIIEQVVITRTRERIQLARTPLLRYHRHIRGRVLRRLAADLGRTPGRSGTRAALSFLVAGASGTGMELAGGLRLERHFDQFIIDSTHGKTAADRPLTIPSPGTGEGEAVIGGRTVRAAWSSHATSAPLTIAFDPAALRFPLELRAWRAGDRIRVDAGTRKLKKLFGERRIPRYSRSRVPVLAQADGSIVWVAGMARAAGTEPETGGRVFHMRVFDGIDGRD